MIILVGTLKHKQFGKDLRGFTFEKIKSKNNGYGTQVLGTFSNDLTT